MAKKKPEGSEPMTDETTATTVPAKRKRSPNKPNMMNLIKTLDAAAIRARLAELEIEQSALKALLSVAEARDEKTIQNKME